MIDLCRSIGVTRRQPPRQQRRRRRPLPQTTTCSSSPNTNTTPRGLLNPGKMVTFETGTPATSLRDPMQTWIPDTRNFAYLTWKQVEALYPTITRCSSCPPRPSSSMATTSRWPPTPLSTTFCSASPLARTSARDAPVYALPPVCYGKSNEHIGFPGTLSVSASTFMAVFRDLGASIAAAGFKKLVLYNTHGGNSSLVDVMARDLRAEFNLRVFSPLRLRRRSLHRRQQAGKDLRLPRR